MDLAPDDELESIADLARTLGLEVLAPAAREADVAGVVPDKVWATLIASGLTVAVPEEMGGGGVLGALARQVAVQNLAYGDPGIAMAAVWSGAVAGLLAAHGSQAQRTLVPALVSEPSQRCGIALYEGFGRGLRDLETTVSVKDDIVRVVGTKVAVPFADAADPLVVVGLDPRSGALMAVVTTTSGDGVTAEPCRAGLALGAARLARVSFDLSLPASAVLGGPDLDTRQLELSLQELRLLVASALIGSARRATEYAAGYVSEREAFGRPVASFQGVSFPLAESLMRLEAARLELADLVTSDDRLTADGLDKAVGDAIAYASSAAVDATRHGIQSLGGHGFVEDHPVELWHRSTTALAALDFDPSSEPFHPAL